MGRVYVHGMPVTEHAPLTAFGLNYTGGGHSLSALGIGRDRGAVRVDMLVGLIPSMVAHLQRTAPAEYEELVGALYELLLQQPDSAVRYLHACNIPQRDREHLGMADFGVLAQGLKQVFARRHGPDAIACSSVKVSGRPHSLLQCI